MDEFYVFAKIPSKAFTRLGVWTIADYSGQAKHLFAYGTLDKMKALYYYVYLDVGYDVAIFDSEGGVVKQTKGFRIEDLDEAKTKSNRSDSHKEFFLSKKAELEERARQLQEESKV